MVPSPRLKQSKKNPKGVMAITCAADFKRTPNFKVTTDNFEVTPNFNTECEFQDSGLFLNRHFFNWVSGLNALTLNQNRDEQNYYNSKFNDISYTTITDT
jgi:hypothetical protein